MTSEALRSPGRPRADRPAPAIEPGAPRTAASSSTTVIGIAGLKSSPNSQGSHQIMVRPVTRPSTADAVLEMRADAPSR